MKATLNNTKKEIMEYVNSLEEDVKILSKEKQWKENSICLLNGKIGILESWGEKYRDKIKAQNGKLEVLKVIVGCRDAKIRDLERTVGVLASKEVSRIEIAAAENFAAKSLKKKRDCGCC
jgi:hypothetical protein